MKRFKLNIQQFAEPGEPKTFTQEEVDEMINKRFARMKADFEKEKKELERKHNESIEDYEERIKNANLTAEEKHKKEIEKIQKDLDAKNAELTKIKTDEIKKATLTKYKMPEKFLDRISGVTEEEIEASVKGFAETMGEYVKSLGASGVPGAMNGGSNGGADKKAQLEELRKKAFESGSDIDRANYVRAKQELENSGGNE
ncbi:capsid assembly scaffolding protein Gp46 family protein [Fusobacterium polymorphum]|uniref:capsid assembly scaffolding protein Gp46 family protein n=1 Tax=Fusobacterium nucleatum subsp. polymorphum TaxID=76857 RepID=UPI0030CD01F5